MHPAQDRFNMNQLQNHFLVEKDLVFEKLLIQEVPATTSQQSHAPSTRRHTKPFYCRTCDSEDSQEVASLACAHEFCSRCWKSYFAQKLAEQSVSISCMEAGCRQPVTHSFMQRLLADSPEELQAYYVCLGRRYIDENQQQNLLNIKWCPGVDCIFSVEKVIITDNEVRCPRGHHWCYICRQEAHAPVSCNVVSGWTRITTTPNESVKWIQENTKLCPFCHRPVEKNRKLLLPRHL